MKKQHFTFTPDSSEQFISLMSLVTGSLVELTWSDGEEMGVVVGEIVSADDRGIYLQTFRDGMYYIKYLWSFIVGIEFIGKLDEDA